MAYRGLGSAEAAARLLEYGPNELGRKPERGWLHLARGIAAEPMFLLLLAAAALYLLIGDLGEGLLLSFFALTTVGLVVLQERRSERALDALRALAAPQVRVLRDGVVTRLPAASLVPGDLFLLGEGERIAADAVLREAAGLAVDESLLTGEAVPVRKLALAEGGPDGGRPGGDDQPLVYAGTLVVGGHGLAQVRVTGRHTEMGRIGAELAALDSGPTPLQQHLRRTVRRLAVGAVALSLALVLWYGLRGGQWLQGALAGIAFAMAMLPEEIPMVLTVFFALGAWRLARAKVLVRRPAVIEALGAATVLCVDKTGTLTENRQRLRRLVTADADLDVAAGGPLPEAVHALLEYAVMASRRGGIDPMDLAVLARGDASLADTEHLHPDWLLEQEYPVTPRLLAMSQAWTRADGTRAVAAKGAPEAVADLCHLAPAATEALLQRAGELARQGLRVLAVASGSGAAGTVAADQHDYDFSWLGLLAFEDPLRPDAAAAVAQARAAGIRVAMITGDHAATALAIAAQAGIATEAGALGGAQIDTLDDAALARALRTVRVFARVMPEQKLRLVRAFQANGETVAMTGDGVNDAPALKAAHVGIAMGVRGTDVAREAAGLVLLDENFAHVVEGVRAGRTIHGNLRKAMVYIVAIHVPVAGLALLPVLFGWPPLLLPAHVVLTEMVIDPACAFTFEAAPAGPDVMRQPPRARGDTLLGWRTLRQGLGQGLLLLLAVLAVYLAASARGTPADEARTLAVVALTAGNLLLVWLNARPAGSWRPPVGWAFPLVSALAIAALALALASAPVRSLLQFGLPSLAELLAAVAAAGVAVLLAAATVGREAAVSTVDAAQTPLPRPAEE